jgi:dihydrofolate reductase
MSNVSFIVACDKNNGIGKDNRLPWHLSEDLKRFKRLTTGHVILMGRKTFDSLPVKPLPERDNIVLTRDEDFLAEGCRIIRDIDQTLRLAQKAGETGQHLFVIGGASVYEQLLPVADRIYMTLIDGVFDTDAHFPTLNPSAWIEQEREDHLDATPYPYSFITYKRKNKFNGHSYE